MTDRVAQPDPRAVRGPVPLLVNPASGGGRGAKLASALAEDQRLRTVPVDAPAAMTAAARRLADEGHERVVVVGGDGTLHHAIQGLAGTRCALGIVPTGTGNDLARALGIERQPAPALERALLAPPRPIDVGRAGSRFFHGVVAVGLVGDVLRHADRVPIRMRGPWIYPYAVCRTALRFRPPRVVLEPEPEGLRVEETAWLAALANTQFLGGGMRVAPDASFGDGLLDVVVVGPISRLRALALFPRVYAGSHLAHPAVRTFRVRAARLSIDRPIDLYADGERLGACERDGTRVECVPGGLLVAA